MFRILHASFFLLVSLSLHNGTPLNNLPWNYIHNEIPPRIQPVEKDISLPVPQAVSYCGYSSVSNDGKSPGKNGKISGGSRTAPHAYPWMAALSIDFVYFCGGTIISSLNILTSGVCLYGRSGALVTVGGHHIEIYEDTQQFFKSLALVVHEDFNPTTLANNVGIVKLAVGIAFASNTYDIRPICLPTFSDQYNGLPIDANVTATGWGFVSDESVAIASTLHAVDLTIAQGSACENLYESEFDDESDWCTNGYQNQGTCEGDNGGPLNYYNKANSLYYIRGIISLMSPQECGDGYPDGFVKVDYYLDWISRNTGIAIDP